MEQSCIVAYGKPEDACLLIYNIWCLQFAKSFFGQRTIAKKYKPPSYLSRFSRQKMYHACNDAQQRNPDLIVRIRKVKQVQKQRLM